MPKITKYQIWRHRDVNNFPLEAGDVFICQRGTQKDAERWIESQKDQFYNHSWYYIKPGIYDSEGNYGSE